MDLTALTATEAAARIARGDLLSEDLVRACLDRIAALEPGVQAWNFLDPEPRARAGARRRHAAPGGQGRRPAARGAHRHQGHHRHRGHADRERLPRPQGPAAHG